MSILDGIMMEYIKSKGDLMPGQPHLNELTDKIYQVDPELRYSLAVYAYLNIQFRSFKRMAEKVGWDLVNQCFEEGFADILEETLFDPQASPFLNQMKSADPDLRAGAGIVCVWDYILGNHDIIVLSEKKRVAARNIYCATWEVKKKLGIEKDLRCEKVCWGSCLKIGRMLNQKIEMIEGKRDGAEIGLPGWRFNTARYAGDDTCEMVATLVQ
jgi:hypothetical protein